MNSRLKALRLIFHAHCSFKSDSSTPNTMWVYYEIIETVLMFFSQINEKYIFIFYKGNYVNYKDLKWIV